MTDEAVRIQKYLSQAGRASRRQAERLMLAGRVKVNGQVVTELGARVVPGHDVVEVDGERVEEAATRWLAFHKPVGVLTTRRDPHGGRTVYDVLPEDARGLRYVGRLDLDTEGLLLMTNEGDALHGLTHPSRQVEREYLATVTGVPTAASLEALERGVVLDDGPARAARAWLVDREGPNGVVGVILTEGRNREVRRLLYHVGHEVQRLVRVRFGSIELGDLAPGAWRPLTPDERARLVERAGTS